MGERRDKFKASPEGLMLVEQAARQRGWGHQSAVWYDRAHVSLATLRRFWQRIPISAEFFVAICDAVGVDWRQVVATDPEVETGQAVEPDTALASGTVGGGRFLCLWLGGSGCVAAAELVRRCRRDWRLLMVTGMTGVGKTALVNQIRQPLAETLTDLRWVNFDGRERTEFAQVASVLVEGVPDLAALSAEDRLSAVLESLVNQPKLVVLDGFEAVLQGNEENGWSEFKDAEWGRFFQRLLAAEACQSVVLVTSQEFPAALRTMGSRYEAVWHSVDLKGLGPEERMRLFAALGVEADQDPQGQDWLRRIGEAYEGHPLALKVITGEILSSPFYGNLAAYWQTYGKEIEQLEQAKAAIHPKGEDDPLRLDCYSRQLRQIVRERIEASFLRLQQEVPLAYQLLCMGSVYRRPVVVAFWLNLLTPFQPDGDQAQLMLDALLDRYLVEEILERNQLHLRQHNLIRSIALSHLRQFRPRHEPPANLA